MIGRTSPHVATDSLVTPEANERLTLIRWVHRLTLATLAWLAPTVALLVYGGASLAHPGILVLLASLPVLAWGALDRTKHTRLLALAYILAVGAGAIGGMSLVGFSPGSSTGFLVLILRHARRGYVHPAGRRPKPGEAPGVEGELVVVRAIDTGTGMSDAVRARIFEPFFTTKPPGRGTGFGLATVFGIVRAHGGAITVESAEKRGSTFSVFLRAGVSAPPLS